ncbi:MAG: site-specific integrase [Deltaproteobacteria bacterium]|nr:site-specific integrase [Deltaproteobacteria bacterium]
MPSIVTKRGAKRYRASVTLQGITRQKMYPDTERKSLQEALVWEKEERKKLEAKLSQTNSASLAIGQWSNEYLTEAESRFVPDTFQEKKAAFARFFKDTELQREFLVQDLTVTICRNYLLKQVQARSGYAANKDRKNLGTAWRWGLDNMEGWPKGVNPFLSVKKFPEERRPRYVPSEEDFWKVFAKAEGQDKVILLTYLHLAARRAEVFRMKWSDVDFTNNKIRLWTQKREGGHMEYDWLPMTSDLRQALLSWCEERLKQTVKNKEHVFICLDKSAFCKAYYGKPFLHRQHLMEHLCKRAKVKPFGFHGIRHLTASILYQKGYSLSVIQTILRHANPNTTARYIHSLGLEETRGALEEGLKGPAQVIQFKKSNVV